ncbi:MAG TPA: 4Fe-4S dicluster domain-containing protein [Longimicrobiales bacterium]|nr:4Fe-4S dicluster domain-containing protein [Longimicrobiales bacterium]
MIASPALLIDTTRCTGCEACVLACKEENALGADRLRAGQETVDGLSSTRFSTILREPGDHFVKQQCRHCLDPACVSACLVGAMQKSPEGPVIYDAELCMGCRYCLVACPYGIPRYEWDQSVPYVRKCTLCYPRLKEGKEPACVEACPEKALLFGSRDDLLREAHARIARRPQRYVDHVWGEKEVGGTSVLYLADVSLGFLGWGGDLGDGPLPPLSWASLKKVPPVIVGMGTLMGGIHWVIRRRMQLAAREAAGAGEGPNPTEGTAAGGDHD